MWYVFRDPRFDVRPLALGAVLPELDGVFGGARVMHSLAFSLILLLVVMVATIGRRAARKRWLGLPIGTMLHLVFDGAWADAHVFWWPFGGWSFDDAPLPAVERGLVEPAPRADRLRHPGLVLAAGRAVRPRPPARGVADRAGSTSRL